MAPSVLLPGKHQMTVCCPENLVVRHYAVKDAAAARIGAPHFATAARFRVSHANRPGQAGAFGLKNHVVARIRNPQKRNEVSVRRPHRLRIVIHAWVKIMQTLVRKGVDHHETVIASAAYKSKP